MSRFSKINFLKKNFDKKNRLCRKLYFLMHQMISAFAARFFSHGWCELLPFEIDKENWRLSYVFIGENSKNTVWAKMSDAEDGRVKIEISGAEIGENFEKKILRDARHVLRLDDDLSEVFINLPKPKNVWIGFGRRTRAECCARRPCLKIW